MTVLLTPQDVATYLDNPVSVSDDRLIGAVNDAWSAVCGYLRFDPSTLPEDSWKRGSAILVAKRCAARLFTNPLDASNVTIAPEAGSWQASSGPRLLTDDEREQLDSILGRRQGRYTGAAGMT